MITPAPRSIMEGSRPRSRRTAGKRLSFMACCHSSSVTVAKPPLGADDPPTLWTITSMPLKLSNISWTTLLAPSAVERSAWTKCISDFSSGADRAVMITVAPARLNRSPIPLPAPSLPPLPRPPFPLNSLISGVVLMGAGISFFMTLSSLSLLPKAFSLALPGSWQRHRWRYPNQLCDVPLAADCFRLWLLLAVACSHKASMPARNRYVQNIFAIDLIAIEYRYGVASFKIFRGGGRGGALWARRTATACRSTRAFTADSGSGRRDWL